MSHRIKRLVRNHLRTVVIFFCLMATASWCPAHEADEVSNADSPPKTIFSRMLPDVSGKRLTVVALNFGPKSDRPSTGRPYDHRHPGSVYVYVTKGRVRWGIEGEPIQELHAGDSFFEPAGVLHTVGENASTTEPASVIAVMIVPDGAPLVLPK